ncbi:bacteriohemerythrin [Magnetospirillum sp. UT-4]|uniref:bacteriohemerythrin n=1 Tax=Magnetospirillum sp. UT-4 TaxID=2681467 RepID=UPI001574B0C0|nr:hemerythrin family protein [Magnetospirillum sp. UT-4]
MLKRLAFLPSFALGIDDIDSDHRMLIELSNRIADAIDRSDYADCEALFDTFIANCAAHFEREEVHLRASRYPQAELHARQHAELLERARGTRSYCSERLLYDQAGECYGKLIDFLVADILRADVYFKSHIEATGYQKG